MRPRASGLIPTFVNTANPKAAETSAKAQMGQGRVLSKVAAYTEATRLDGGDGSWEGDGEREVGGHGEGILEKKCLGAGGHASQVCGHEVSR